MSIPTTKLIVMSVGSLADMYFTYGTHTGEAPAISLKAKLPLRDKWNIAAQSHCEWGKCLFIYANAKQK